MANTLSGLMPTIFAALDEVSREQVGFIPAVSKFPGSERAAVGQTIAWPVVSGLTPTSITAGMVPPTPVDIAITPPTMTISKAYRMPVVLTGEDEIGMGGATTDEFWKQAFAQAMRALVNLIEVDLFTAAKEGSSRAYGTAGTAPFGTASDLTDFAQVNKILNDNGAPLGTRHLVLNSAAVANLQAKQMIPLSAAGASDMLLRGSLGMLGNVKVHLSGGISVHTIGTGAAAYAINYTPGYAIGSTALVVDTGSGTFLKGDVITNEKTGKDAVKYISATDGTTVLLTLAKPGIRVAWADNDPLTVGAAYTGNFLFSQDAIWLATRPPASPSSGEMAIDSTLITDPVSGLKFEVREYAGYREHMFEVSVAWGVKAVKTEHIATLLG